MNRCSLGAASFLIGLTGCGGSSSNSSDASTPTGGGGTVADYVGTYAGTYYTLPETAAVGENLMVGTASLVIAADGTVSGTRREAASNADATFVGTITPDGTLSLAQSGATAGIGLHGSLVKRASGAVVTFAESVPPSMGDVFHYYRFTGGSAEVGAEPRTAGTSDAFLKDYAATYTGAWSRPEAGTSGALRLTYSTSGKVGGSWTNTDGTVRTISGSLREATDNASRYFLSGRLSLKAKGLATLQIDVRLVIPDEDENPGPLPLAGTATDIGGDGNAYGLYVVPQRAL